MFCCIPLRGRRGHVACLKMTQSCFIHVAFPVLSRTLPLPCPSHSLRSLVICSTSPLSCFPYLLHMLCSSPHFVFCFAYLCSHDDCLSICHRVCYTTMPSCSCTSLPCIVVFLCCVFARLRFSFACLPHVIARFASICSTRYGWLTSPLCVLVCSWNDQRRGLCDDRCARPR